jgi:hypothetical protein
VQVCGRIVEAEAQVQKRRFKKLREHETADANNWADDGSRLTGGLEFYCLGRSSVVLLPVRGTKGWMAARLQISCPGGR